MDLETMSPTETIVRFGECLYERDLESALALYEPDAVFQPAPDAPAVRGREAIREALAPFFALGGRIESSFARTHETGGIAFVANRWRLLATQPDGTPLELSGTSTDVLRRRADGSWGILVDDPWGAA